MNNTISHIQSLSINNSELLGSSICTLSGINTECKKSVKKPLNQSTLSVTKNKF